MSLAAVGEELLVAGDEGEFLFVDLIHELEALGLELASRSGRVSDGGAGFMTIVHENGKQGMHSIAFPVRFMVSSRLIE